MKTMLLFLSILLAICGAEASHPRDAFTRVMPREMTAGAGFEFDWMTLETLAARRVHVPHHQKRATSPDYSGSPYLNNNTESW